MNAAQLHLILTHLPIVGLGMTILINVYAIIRKNDELMKLTLLVYLVIGVFALLAYMTGDSAKDIVKTYPGVSEDVIETHENTAIFFLIGMMVTFAIAAIGLYVTKTKEALLRKFNFYLLIAALSLSILAVMTGSTGGKIRHSEIEHGVYKK